MVIKYINLSMVGIKIPPILFPVVFEVNSLGDSKHIHRKINHMATLTTAASVIKTLAIKCQLDKADKAYLENASLWVFSIKDLIVNSRKQGSGVTLTAKKGYITTRQSKKGETITLPYYQTTNVKTFAPKIDGDKVSAFHSTLTHKEDGHEYPYNTKLNFTFSMCYEIALAVLGEVGIKSLLQSELAINPEANPKDLLKKVTKVSSWWRKMVTVLPGADIQIQLLCIMDPEELGKCVVKNIYGTQEKALEIEVNPHVRAFQVVSSVHKEYIWGADLPPAIVQVLDIKEKQEVTVYKSVEEIPYNSKQAETQLRKLFVPFLKENEEYQTTSELAIQAFLTQVNPNIKLGKWLALEVNKEKAVKWLSKIKFNPEKTGDKQDFDKSSTPKQERQADNGGSTLSVIPPSEEEKKEESTSDNSDSAELSETFAWGDDD
jgi:hypothetical protein